MIFTSACIYTYNASQFLSITNPCLTVSSARTYVLDGTTTNEPLYVHVRRITHCSICYKSLSDGLVCKDICRRWSSREYNLCTHMYIQQHIVISVTCLCLTVSSAKTMVIRMNNHRDMVTHIVCIYMYSISCCASQIVIRDKCPCPF